MSVQAEAKTYLNYINGEWAASLSDKVDASINPAHRHEIVGYVQKSAREDLDRAVAAAKKAQAQWRKLSAPARGGVLVQSSQCDREAFG